MSDTTFGVIHGESEPLHAFLVTDLRKELTAKMQSNQGRTLGRVAHPFNMTAAHATTLAVSIHAVCINTKRDAIVGLGFETEEERVQRQRKKELDDAAHQTALAGPQPPGKKGDAPPKPVAKALPPEPVDGEDPPADGETPADADPGGRPRSRVEEILDPFCEDGFQSLINRVGEDYETTGNGYIEVVRDGQKINALWFMPATAVHVVNEQEKPFTHFEVDDESGTLKYAAFGDLEAMKARTKTTQPQVTELIHFKKPTAKHPRYGIVDWLAVVPWLELAQMLIQYNFDYFQNRAVPDLILMITGAKVQDEDMKKLQEQLKKTTGKGNRFKTVVSNIPHPDAKTQLDRLESDNREKFVDLWTTIQMEIVTAHRVPPLLAGVVLPGKMAAANELPNALIAFQTLYVAQHQKVFELKLGSTLGSQEAGLGLKSTDFLLKKITDYYDMGQVDTMSRMRETATEAQLKGRDLENGLKE